MPNPRPRSRGTVRLVLGALCVASLLDAGAASAISIGLSIDPAQSALQPEGQAAQPLSGGLVVRTSAPGFPVSARSAFDVVALAASGGGLDIALDPDLQNPGLGWIDPDGSFAVPLLFLEVNGVDLTLVDVAGTFAPSAACGGELCLETTLVIDTLSPTGLVQVDVVAAVPEPSSVFLMAAALGGLAALRRRAEVRR